MILVTVTSAENADYVTGSVRLFVGFITLKINMLRF